MIEKTNKGEKNWLHKAITELIYKILVKNILMLIRCEKNEPRCKLGSKAWSQLKGFNVLQMSPNWFLRI